MASSTSNQLATELEHFEGGLQPGDSDSPVYGPNGTVIGISHALALGSAKSKWISFFKAGYQFKNWVEEKVAAESSELATEAISINRSCVIRANEKSTYWLDLPDC